MARVPRADGSYVVVLDMGGVLYDFQGAALIARASRRARRWRSEEVRAHWAKLLLGFETGTSSETAFAESIVERFELTLAPDEFLLAFRNAAVGFYEGALSLVAELRQRHRVVSLSNTNAVQWPKVLSDLGPSDPFHAHHPSHVSGFHKPDLRAFHGTRGEWSDASGVHFFDDRSENVAAALRFGWHAQRVRGVAETRAACSRAGLI